MEYEFSRSELLLHQFDDSHYANRCLLSPGYKFKLKVCRPATRFRAFPDGDYWRGRSKRVDGLIDIDFQRFPSNHPP